MPQCSHCGANVGHDHQICPFCSTPIDDVLQTRSGENTEPTTDQVDEAETMDGQLAPIARFKNAAEAGYFAHELMQRENIPVTVTVNESFDAISGYWSSRYVLAVSEDVANFAAARLQDFIERSETEEQTPSEVSDDSEDWSSEFDDSARFDPAVDFSKSAQEESGVNWVPIVLTLAAGSVVFWGARRMQAHPQPEPPRRGEHVELWDHLATPSNPWVQQLEGGRGHRELWIDAKRHEGMIREDVDGDGRFETKIRLRFTIPGR